MTETKINTNTISEKELIDSIARLTDQVYAGVIGCVDKEWVRQNSPKSLDRPADPTFVRILARSTNLSVPRAVSLLVTGDLED